MRLTLEIECTTPAFDQNLLAEAAEIMRDVADQVRCGNLNPKVADSDGHRAGRLIVTYQEPA